MKDFIKQQQESEEICDDFRNKFGERSVEESEVMDWLRTTLQSYADQRVKEALEEIVGIVEEKSKTKVYKIRKHNEPFSVTDITIPYDYESAFRLGEKITLTDLTTTLRQKIDDINK